MMRPTVEIKKIRKSLDREEVLEFDLDIRGCRTVDLIRISQNIFPDQTFSTEVLSSEKNTPMIKAKLRVTIRDTTDSRWDSEMDLLLYVECDSSIFSSEHGNLSQSNTHYFRARSDPSFSVQHKEFSLSSLRLDQLGISNFVLAKVNDSVILQKSVLEYEMVYSYTLFLEFGGVPRFRIQYDPKMKTAMLSFIEKKKTEDIQITGESDAGKTHSFGIAIMNLF